MGRRCQRMVALCGAQTLRQLVQRFFNKKLLFVCFEASLHGRVVHGAVHDDAKLRQLLLGYGNAAVAIKTGLPDLLHDHPEHSQRLAEQEILELMEPAQQNLHLHVARHLESFGHDAKQTHEALEEEPSPHRSSSIAFQALTQIHHLLAEILAC